MPFQSPVDSLRDQSSHARQCHGLTGILVKSTRDLSPAASRQFPMIIGDTAGATCALFSSLDAVRAATAASTMRQS